MVEDEFLLAMVKRVTQINQDALEQNLRLLQQNERLAEEIAHLRADNERLVALAQQAMQTIFEN